MDEIAVIAYEEYAQGKKYERELLIGDKTLEIKRRAELMPEAAVFYGLERGRVLEQEKRRYADENGNAAGYGEENDVVVYCVEKINSVGYDELITSYYFDKYDEGTKLGLRLVGLGGAIDIPLEIEV